MALLSPGDRVKLGLRRLKRVSRRPLDTLDDLGDQLGFYGRALAWTPRTLKRYKRETFRLLAEVVDGVEGTAPHPLEPAQTELDPVAGREQRHHCPFGGTSWK